jgi:hypothetical protein
MSPAIHIASATKATPVSRPVRASSPLFVIPKMANDNIFIIYYFFMFNA